MSEDLQEKIKTIKEFKQPIIESMNCFIDQTIYYKENLDKYPSALSDEKTKQYINDLAKIGENYEFLRQRLLKNDFNLSPYEINMCAVALARQKSSFTNNIITLNKGIEIINSIGKILAGEEFEYLLDK